MNRSGISTIASILVGIIVAGIALLALNLRGNTATAADHDDDLPVAMETAEPPTHQVASELPAESTAPAEPEEPELRIVVDTRRRLLLLLQDVDTLMRAPVAIGMNAGFEYEGRKWHFETPRGTRRVLAKARDPVWTVPEWHYYEKATKKGLEVAKLQYGDTVALEDGSYLVATDSAIGRINQFGHFAAFTPGVELIFDGRIYIPPLDSEYRRVRDALGPYKLDMGDGYLIHGTHYYNEDSVGEAVSHGCVRMSNDDITRLYQLVPRGTIVEII